MQVADLALQRSKYKHLTDEQWRWFLQQVEGRERTAEKLPTFATIEDWWYPVRLSCEQCSSELTARYKAHIIESSNLPILKSSNCKCIDLTGGYGVDTFFLSELFEETDYVEQNAELCRIAEHNFALGRKSKVERQKLSIAVHNCTAEEFLLSSPCGVKGFARSSVRWTVVEQIRWGLIFLDPARRDSHGGKVFRLGDCTPNVVELMPDLVSHLAPEGRIMLKLSPMIDLTQAIKELSAVSNQPSVLTWDIHVVAVKNEVKEVLLLSHQKSDVSTQTITAIDLDKKEQAFVFTREEEKAATVSFVHGTLSPCTFLYEPNAAILKGGAYKLVSERFGLQKLDVNTHLYVSDKFVEHFPGRVWKTSPLPSPKERVISQANVIVRNYPLTAEQLKKKLHLRDGGTAYVIGCRVNGKPVLFSAERV